MECEYPVAVAKVTLFGCFGSLCDARRGQAGKLGAVVHHYLERVGGVEEVFVEGEIQFGKFGVYGFKFFFLFGREEGAVAGEVFVIILHCALLVGVEALAIVVDCLDAGEERVVHRHFVGKLRVCRIELFSYLHHFWRGVGLVECEEYVCHLVEYLAAVLKGHYCVLESGGVGIRHNFEYLCFLLGYAAVEGGEVVPVADFVEGRNFVRRFVRRQEWVLGHFVLICAVAGRCKRQGCGSDKY